MESVKQQLRQLKENYEHMTDDELCAVAGNAYDLAEIAREALQAVVSEKGIAVRLRLEPPPWSPAEPPDEDLVIFSWPRNSEEAGHTMKTLAAAGIPSFLSLEIRADDVKRAQAAMDPAAGDDDQEEPEEEKNYAILCPKCRSGAVVLEERDSFSTAPFHWHCDTCGYHWSDEDIEQAAQPGQKDETEEEKNYAILCPKCRSAKVVLEGRDSKLAEPPPTARFQWRCDACGHLWVDDGIEQKVDGGQSWPGEEFPAPSEEWDPK